MRSHFRPSVCDACVLLSTDTLVLVYSLQLVSSHRSTTHAYITTTTIIAIITMPTTTTSSSSSCCTVVIRRQCTKRSRHDCSLRRQRVRCTRRSFHRQVRRCSSVFQPCVIRSPSSTSSRHCTDAASTVSLTPGPRRRTAVFGRRSDTPTGCSLSLPAPTINCWCRRLRRHNLLSRRNPLVATMDSPSYPFITNQLCIQLEIQLSPKFRKLIHWTVSLMMTAQNVDGLEYKGAMSTFWRNFDYNTRDSPSIYPPLDKMWQ